MASTSKRHFTVEQKRVMLDFLNQHPQLYQGKFDNKFTFKEAQQQWTRLAELLNAIPGARKNWIQWRKTWQDYKGNIKKKAAGIRREQSATGGGPQTVCSLTTEEEAVIQIVGISATEGHPNIMESEVF
nr:unnamed protein product [Callosobruchus analis]